MYTHAWSPVQKCAHTHKYVTEKGGGRQKDTGQTDKWYKAALDLRKPGGGDEGIP